MSNKTESGKFVLKAYSPKEIRGLYGVSEIVFKAWLKPIQSEIGELIGRYYNAKQIQIIINHLGIPGVIEL